MNRRPIGLTVPYREVGYTEKKGWVSLTEEEVKECFKITPDMHLPWHIYKRIEDKLKEKNDTRSN
jgi:hypothetical protein